MDKIRKDEGFTLIELLVVVAIIGILAAIAIPQYAEYKQRSVDATMRSDLHNAATAMEAVYGDNNNSYSGADLASLTNAGYRQTAGLTLSVASGTNTFLVTAAKPGGSQANFTFDSTSGQIQ